MPRRKLVICPYCGETQAASERCRACGGLFDPLSRQATHNEMGPWFIRSERRPFQPGCSYETLIKLIGRGVVDRHTRLRGPTTRQFWTIAKRVPGVAHLLGHCHACGAEVDPDEPGCHECGALFGPFLERDSLGLPDVRPLPGDVQHEEETSGNGFGGASAGKGPLAAASTRSPRTVATGISSFVPDEELLQHDRAEAVTAATVPDAPIAPPEAAGESRADAASEDDPVLSPAMRSMQRRLAQQRRTIRRLIVLVIAVALAGVVINALVLAGSRRQQGTTGGESAQPMVEDASSPGPAVPRGEAEPGGEAPLDASIPQAGPDDTPPLEEPAIPDPDVGG